MINIPKQTQSFNFVILGGDDGKKPIEKGWNNKIHRFGDTQLLQHLSQNKNYGVRCGYSSSLHIGEKDYALIGVDFDNEELQNKLLPLLPKTYSVKTGGKGLLHLYYASDGDKSYKIFDEQKNTLCDVQGEGKQLVGAGSINPKTGRAYEIVDDVPIAVISYAELKAILSAYDKSPKNERAEKKQYSPKGISNDDVQKIFDAVSMIDVLHELGVDTSRNPTACPMHSSRGGKCLGFNDITAHCFHCDKSWNKYSLIRDGKNLTDKDTFNWFAEKSGMQKELDDARKKFIDEHNPDKNLGDDGKELPRIELPTTGILHSKYALEVSEILKNKNHFFYRQELRDIVEIGQIKTTKGKEYTGFIPVQPSRFITSAEKYFTPIIKVKMGRFGEVEMEKSMSNEIAKIVLSADCFQSNMPQISRIFTIPIPILYNGELTFPTKGYDERFLSWLPYSAPEILQPNMKIEEAKKIIDDLLDEFCFQDKQDKVNAVAGLLTPFLRGLYPTFNTRAPVFFYIANRERAGKDYLSGIRGIVYEGYALEEAPISNSENSRSNNTDELRKKILAAFISGRKLMHFANNKGFIDNAVFEQVTTAAKHSDRILGKSEVLSFDNEIDFSLSGNVGVGYTADFANRCRFVRLFLDIEDANSRKFKKPNLHGWVFENRGLILSAMFALVKNWISKGKKRGEVPFASFPEWAAICGGIMEAAGYDNPCSANTELIALGGDGETKDMKQLFEICYEKKPDEYIKKSDIKALVQEEDNDLFSWVVDKSSQIRFGLMLNKFSGRVLSNIRMELKDSSVRSARQEFRFVKQKPTYSAPKKDKDLVMFGNVGNDTYPKVPGENSITQYVRLPGLPNITNNEEDINNFFNEMELPT